MPIRRQWLLIFNLPCVLDTGTEGTDVEKRRPCMWASNPPDKILSQEAAEKRNQRRALGSSEKRAPARAGGRGQPCSEGSGCKNSPNPHQAFQAGTVTTPLSQTRKLRHRVVKQCAQHHTSSKQWNQGVVTDSWAPSLPTSPASSHNPCWKVSRHGQMVDPCRVHYPARPSPRVHLWGLHIHGLCAWGAGE